MADQTPAEGVISAHSDGNGIADVWWREGTTSTVEIWLLSVD